ncbi:DUF4376 domain-containing protein [Silvimonas soli]|uniref:DUF4376 domain-containing protein n=1 Tax=Silvimonas soli TaxID=2980100 RepID=UPI0024B3498A|nr:DUF4376 domain-containing protein [Silvimonas soli]
MTVYAYVQNGVVVELVASASDANGKDIPLDQRFVPDFVASLVDLTGVEPQPEQRWTYDGKVFTDPSYVSPAQLLANAQETQIATIYDAYVDAIQQPVSFTPADGQAKAFQADAGSQTVLLQAITGYGLAGTVPEGFYWVSEDNTQNPFTLADLKGLYAVMLAQGWAAFQKRQTLKAEILAATTVAAVQAIDW